MGTKFTQKYAQVAQNLILCKNRGIFRKYSGVYGADEFTYTTRIFQGAKGVAMATKFGQN